MQNMNGIEHLQHQINKHSVLRLISFLIHIFLDTLFNKLGLYHRYAAKISLPQVFWNVFIKTLNI